MSVDSSAAVIGGNGDGNYSVHFKDEMPTVVGGSAPSKLSEQAATPMEKAGNGNLGQLRQRYAGLRKSLREFLARTTQVSYFLITIAVIAVVVLLLIVGLAAGLGPSRTCSKKAAKIDGKDGQSGGQVSIPYEPNKPWTYWRLPGAIVPNHYDISIAPYFYTEEEKAFDGNVTIEATVAASTKLIILHALDIHVHDASVAYVDSAAGTAPGIKRTFVFDHYNYFVIELRSRLKVNQEIAIKLSFNGTLSTASEGFYKSFFRHPTTSKKLFVAMTQFEPLDARRAFPCFDEPNMKAFFTISMRHRRDFKALSNMPGEVTGNDPNSEFVTTRFQKTPVRMSTYLVCFVAGQFSSLPSVQTNSTNLPITIYAPDYALEQTRYALGVAPRIVEWMQRYYGAPYPLPKLDFVVYPQFRWSAMENWGLITFREEALLVSNETTEVDRDHVVMVVAHELAHQWFGNLVTMDWWDDLWLNEGFASYMEYPSSISVGRMVDFEEYYDFLGAVNDDAFNSSRPIRFLEIRSRNDIDSAFDAITYMKGSTVIRMLVNAMGITKFKHGIQDYMQRYQYKNARTSDLWAALSKEYSGVNVTEVMTTWVEQKGFPLLTAEIGAGGDDLVLRQEPFTIPQFFPDKWDGNIQTAPIRRWWIPVSVQDPSGAMRTEWFPPNATTFRMRMTGGAKPEETKLNANQTAFMRVNYPAAMWEKFGEKLAQDINAFEPMDRAGIVDDCLELAKAGLLQYDTAFRTIRFLAKETHPLVWDVFVAQANFLNQMLWDSPQYSKFKAWLSGTIRSARVKAIQDVANVTPQNAIKNPNYKRILAVLAEAALLFDPGVDAQCYVNTYYRDRKWEQPANHEIRRAIFIAFLQSNDSVESINELLQLAKKSGQKQVLKQVYYAIARTKKFYLLSRELQKLFSDEINPSDFLTLANYASNDNRHRAFMWDWARENFDRLQPYFGGPTIKFMTWFVNIAKYFNTVVKYSEFEAFATTTVRDFGAGHRARRLVEDQMRRNIFWSKHLKKQLETYLAGLPVPTLSPSNIC